MPKRIQLLNSRKRFGQNFLCDEAIIARIRDNLVLQPNDRLIEIGPGYGALTMQMLPIVKKMQVVELDRDLIPHLHLNCDSLGELVIYQADALRFDFNAIIQHQPTRIIGNLPYNISTPLLFHLLQYVEDIVDMHFMLQKEVVMRMCAKPNSSAYGRLSVMLQYYCDIDELFTVPPTAFNPSPKVNSAMVCLRPKKNIQQQSVPDIGIFAAVVRAAFNLRRKTLSNSLKAFLTPADWQKLAINPQLRAENLSITDYIKIANYTFEHQTHK